MKRLPAVAAAIFLFCTALHYYTRSPALDEWDSVQFALGVGDFNLWRHQPHPPGYPLYEAFGWLVVHLAGLDVHDALSLGSALGGGLFVAGWYVLAARRFALPVAALATAALAGMVTTWMSATKVLTDPLGAGLLTLALVCFDGAAGPLPLLWGGLAAAAATGVRPQNFGILLLIVVLAVFGAVRHGSITRRQAWAAGLGAFLMGCLLWLAPVLAIQAHTPESGGRWLAYLDQLFAQWRWRLDQPKAFVGAATGPGQGMWLYRLDHHLLGWFTRGFGFPLKVPWGWVGLAVIVAGWGLYAAVVWRRAAPVVNARLFWRTHLPWMGAYILMIFCCLPGDQRYYLPVFPLFTLAATAGWWLAWRGPWRWLAGVVPVVCLLATLPLIGPNHREVPPPVRLLRFLQARYPSPGEQAGVWLVLRDSWRHAQWYAPGFHLVKAENFHPDRPPEGFAAARAVYTDDPLIVQAFPGTTLAGHFQRSPLIYRKHNTVDLYLLGPRLRPTLDGQDGAQPRDQETLDTLLSEPK